MYNSVMLFQLIKLSAWYTKYTEPFHADIWDMPENYLPQQKFFFHAFFPFKRINEFKVMDYFLFKFLTPSQNLSWVLYFA